MRPDKLEATVRKLCPLVVEQSQRNQYVQLGEGDVILELVCCILSSQVPYAMAVAATRKLEVKGLLNCERWRKYDVQFGADVEGALLEEIEMEGRRRKYRFPYVRARQITSGRDTILRNCGGLTEMLENATDPLLLRRRVVGTVCGLGAKQASMFIRNVELSFELAILDRHVLRYMAMIGLIDTVPTSLSIAKYEGLEIKIQKYADAIGYRTGHVDWAIWITMQAAREVN